MASNSSTAFGKKPRPSRRIWQKKGKSLKQFSGWECGHCKLKVCNKDASRLVFRLSGDVGLRDNGGGFTGTEVCLRVSPKVADRAKTEMAAKTAKKARKSSLNTAA